MPGSKQILDLSIPFEMAIFKVLLKHSSIMSKISKPCKYSKSLSVIKAFFPNLGKILEPSCSGLIITGLNIIIYPTFESAITSAIFSSPSNAVISLIISAPASIAALATSDFQVSTEITTSISDLIALIIGTILSISSSTEINLLPGLVDSPPISSIYAHFETSSFALLTALLISKYFPPSEKESGVIFKIEQSLVLSPFLIDLIPNLNSISLIKTSA